MSQEPPERLRGRPPVKIDLAALENHLQVESKTRIAESLGVHRNTLYRHLREPKRYVELEGVSKIIAEYYNRRLQEREQRRAEKRIKALEPKVIGRPAAKIDVEAAKILVCSIPVQEVAKQLGVSRNTLSRHLKLAGYGRNVTGWRPGVPQPDRFRGERIELCYPYIVSTVVEGSDLVLMVNQAVSYDLPPNMRADICQEMLLAVLSGEIDVNNLKAMAGKFIKAQFRQFPSRFGPMSLDHPAPGDPYGRSLKELLSE